LNVCIYGIFHALKNFGAANVNTRGECMETSASEVVSTNANAVKSCPAIF